MQSHREQGGEGWLEESRRLCYRRFLSVRYLRDIYVGVTNWLEVREGDFQAKDSSRRRAVKYQIQCICQEMKEKKFSEHKD